MGDYFPGKIEIGGPLTAELYQKFLEALDGTVRVSDYNGPDDISSIRNEIDNAIANATTVEFYNDQARGGMFEEIETWCQSHGLTYVRHSEAKFEFDAELAWWQPGMEHPNTVVSNNAHEVLINIVVIQECLEEPNDALKVAALQLALVRSTPPEVSKLTMVVPAVPIPNPNQTPAEKVVADVRDYINNHGGSGWHVLQHSLIAYDKAMAQPTGEQHV